MKHFVSFGLSLVAATALALPQTPAPAPPPPPAAHPGFEVSECAGCHAEAVSSFAQTHHGRRLARSCAECHGDVAAHVKAVSNGEGTGPIISFKTLAPADVNAKCLTCHDKARQVNWPGGVHDRRGLSCITCHSVHNFKTDRAQLKMARTSDVCYGCHQNQRSQSMRTSHHPVREGKMDCGSCHNPHGSPARGMLKADSVNELCYSCHTEKRGPFLWEHAPVRENCTLCHQPHGSNHDKLLVAKMPYLCQRCHLNLRHPGSLYDLRNTEAGANPSNRAIEHACRNCHQNVHGGNAPSGPYLGR